MPSQRGARAVVAPNIYKDRLGYSVSVKVGSGVHARSREKRFPRGTSFEAMKRWRDDTRRHLRTLMPRARSELAGTLNADVKRYLKIVVGLDSPETRGYELDAWLPAFGTRQRLGLTTPELDAQLHAWKAAGASPITCNHRRNALIQLWRTLDGPDADNPAEHTTHFREPSGEPREIPADAVDEIIDAMPPSKSRAMYRLMLETGWPPARIRRMRPYDVAWDVPSVYLVDRRKGHGTVGRHYPLTTRGLAALKEFQAMNAWGGVTRQSIYLVFDRALKTVNRQRERDGRPLLSPTLRPYDARHTVGTQIYRATGDLPATAEFLGVTLETALRYTRAAIPQRLSVATAALDAVRASRGQPQGQPQGQPVVTDGDGSRRKVAKRTRRRMASTRARKRKKTA